MKTLGRTLHAGLYFFAIAACAIGCGAQAPAPEESETTRDALDGDCASALGACYDRCDGTQMDCWTNCEKAFNDCLKKIPQLEEVIEN